MSEESEKFQTEVFSELKRQKEKLVEMDKQFSESKTHLIEGKEDIELLKHCLIGIFGVLRILEPKISPFVSKSEKQEIRTQLEFLGKTIIRLTEE